MKVVGIIWLAIASAFNLFQRTIIYPERDVYISSKIPESQVSAIQKAMDQMGLARTFDRDSNIIRIQYDNNVVANTQMSASLYSPGWFLVDRTLVSFNPVLTGNMLSCVILHELGHTQGVNHNDIMGSIMNFTILVDKNAYILNEDVECLLSYDDIDAMETLKLNVGYT